MFFAALLAAGVLPMPPETPIACQVCKPTSAAAATFSGTVKLAETGKLAVFDAKTRQSMAFTVPPGYRGVTSSDGTIKDGAITTATPGLLARVTYQTDSKGRHVVTSVLLLTLNQCRALMAAEHISKSKSGCPD